MSNEPFEITTLVCQFVKKKNYCYLKYQNAIFSVISYFTKRVDKYTFLGEISEVALIYL